MDILEVIRSRRTIRKYSDEPLAPDIVTKLLEAGRWAPSARNNQPWKFIVINNKDIIRDLASVIQTGKYIADVSLAIAVVVDPEARRFLESGSAAIYGVMLEAHALGLGTGWIGCYDGAQEEPAKKILGIPDEERLQAIITVGYPSDIPEKTRKDIEEITFYNKYGNK